jgi:hypothetical protein
MTNTTIENTYRKNDLSTLAAAAATVSAQNQHTELTTEVQTLLVTKTLAARAIFSNSAHAESQNHTLFDKFNIADFSLTTRVQMGSSTVWLPALDSATENSVFTSRRRSAAAFRNIYGSSSADLWDKFYFRCTNISKCTFATKDIEKAYTHANQLCTHRIFATFEDCAVHSFISERSALAEADLSAERLINRTHLFSNRLATLSKMGTVALFEHSGSQLRKTYHFNDNVFTLIFSIKDHWTHKYIKLLRPLEVKAQFGFDFNINIRPHLPDFSSLFEAFGSTGAAAEIIRKLAACAGLMSNIAILLSEPSTFIASCAIVGIASHLTSAFAATIATFLGVPMAQSSFTWVPHAVGMLLLVILGVNKVSGPMGLTILNRITSLGFSLSGVGTVTRIIKDAWKDLFPFIYEKIYGIPPDFEEAIIELDEFDQLTRAVEDFEKTEGYKTIDSSRDACSHVRTMDETLKRVIACADRRRLREKFSLSLRVVSKRIDTWMDAVRTSPHKDVGVRVEPIIIYMYGASNVGKSLATTLLITDIIKDQPEVLAQPNVEIASFIYTRNPALEYWEGYDNTKQAVIYDDFLQRADSIANPNPEILEIIRIKNSAAFQVPKATLMEKKNSYFKSSLVVCTSNQPTIEAKSITCAEALKRRFDIHVKVERDPDVIVGAEVNTDCYIFTLVKDDKLTDIVLNYQQLVTLARMKMHAQGQKVVGLANSLRKVREAPIIDVPLPDNLNMMDFIQNPAYSRNATQITSTIVGSATAAVPRIVEAHSLAETALNYFANRTVEESNQIAVIERTPHLNDRERILLIEAMAEVEKDSPTTGIFMDLWSVHKLNIYECVAPEYQQIAHLAKLHLNATPEESPLSGDHKPVWFKSMVRLMFTKENVQIFRRSAYSNLTYVERTNIMDQHFSYFENVPDVDPSEALENHSTEETIPCMFAFARAQASATWTGWFRERLHDAQDAGGFIWEHMLSHAFSYLWNGVKDPNAPMMQKLASAYTMLAVFSMIKLGLGKIAYNYGYISTDTYNALWGILPEETRNKLVSAEAYAEIVKQVEDGNLPKTTAHELTTIIKGKISSESWTHAGKTPAMKTQTAIRAPKAEAVTDANCKDVSSKVSDNLAMFYIGNGVTNGQHCAIGLFVRDQSCLLNKHSLDQLLNTPSAVFATFPGTITPVEINMKDVAYSRHPDHDLAMVRFPRLRAHVDIVNQFCTDDDMNFERSVFKILSRDKKMHAATVVKGKKMTEAVHSTFGDSIIPITKGFEYEHAETTFGDCGSPVLVVNPMIARKILGIHGAGVGTTGFAIAVTRSMIDHLLENFPAAHSLVLPEVVTQHFRQTNLEGNFEYLGTVPPPFDPVRTDVTQSEIFGVFPVTTAAAILKPVQGICPLLKGVQLMGKPKPKLTTAFLERNHEMLVALTCPGEAAISRVLTMTEAVFGIPGILKPMELSTSPGYPWCNMQKPAALPGKLAWIYPTTQTLHPDLVVAVERHISNFKNGIIEPPIFKASLKDERRKLKRCDYSKPEDMKTRVFCASPMDFLIAMRMYFGAYFQHVIDHRIKNWSTVGINPDSAEWDQLVRHLHHHGTNVKDGDYEGFDTSQCPDFIQGSLAPADDFYELHGSNNDTDRFIRKGFAHCISYPTLLVKGDLLRLDGVNPSGVLGTTQINNNTNASAFHFAWTEIYGTGPHDFLNNVRMALYGDDNIFTVSQDHPEFTAASIAQHLKKVGMTYTAIDKTLNFKDDGKITDATFLKRGFVFMDGHWRAPLDIATCKELANYTRKSMDNTTATLVNCRTAATELAYTDPSGKTTEAIEKALLAVGLYERLPRLSEVLLNSNKNF